MWILKICAWDISCQANKNESTGEITRYEFENVDPQEYLAQYKQGKDSTIVGNLICQEKFISNKERTITRI